METSGRIYQYEVETVQKEHLIQRKSPEATLIVFECTEGMTSEFRPDPMNQFMATLPSVKLDLDI